MAETARAASLETARHFVWASVQDFVNREKAGWLRKELLGQRVLDAGCGGGSYTAHIASLGFEAVGLDNAPELLAHARSVYPHCGFVEGDLARLPFSDQSFDCAFLSDVLEHVADEEAVLRELARVVRQRILLTVPLENDPLLRASGLAFAHFEDPTHRRYYNEASLTAAADRAGLAVLGIHRGIGLYLSAFAKYLIEPRGIVSRIIRPLLYGRLKSVRYRSFPTTLFAVLAPHQETDISVS